MKRRAWAGLAVALAAGCGTPAAAPTVRVTIPRSATLDQVTDSLVARGAITSPRWFRFYARLMGKEAAIRAGTYDVPRGASAPTALRILTIGRPAEQRLVVPEGLMLSEVARLIERQLGIPAESVIRTARDPALLARFGIPATTAEGYLYPSTYLVPVGAGAADVVRQMLNEFASRWQPAWDSRLDSLGLSRHQIVTLASIIEGEVRYPPDRPYVSSVYHNRLRRGMRLQADPTVIYALGRRRRLYEKDYQTRSAHNTYLIDGLPPTPIGQPSAASIEAALYPARTNFLYLVARPDGKHIFSRNLREHLKAVAEARNGLSPRPPPP